MDEERKERRFRLGAVDLEFPSSSTGWFDVTDLQDLMDMWNQQLQDKIDTIVQGSKFVPSRVRICYDLGEEWHDGSCASPSLAVYGYRPETDKELAARIERQQKKQQRKETKTATKEQKERQLLAELKTKYEETA